MSDPYASRSNNNHHYNGTDYKSQHLLSIYYVPGAVLRALPQHFEKQPWLRGSNAGKGMGPQANHVPFMAVGTGKWAEMKTGGGAVGRNR